MTFVLEYGALRWGAVAAFVVAAGIVLVRLGGARAVVIGARPVGGVGERALGAMAGPGTAVRSMAVGAGVTGGRELVSVHRGWVADRESDAAHLVMCLVMLAMLVFPAQVDARAVRGVLTAMTVAYVALLVGRIMQWRSVFGDNAGARRGDGGTVARTDRTPRGIGIGVRGDRTARDAVSRAGAPMPGEGVVAFGYHVLAALAMLYAMSGHMGTQEMAGMHGGGPAPGVMAALAGLFVADAVIMAVPAVRRMLRHVFPHPVGVGSVAVVPHLVMDLGTAFMLVAAAVG